MGFNTLINMVLGHGRGEWREEEEERGPNNKAIYHVAREEREGSIAAYSKEQGLPGAISLLKEAGCGGLDFSPICDRVFGV